MTLNDASASTWATLPFTTDTGVGESRQDHANLMAMRWYKVVITYSFMMATSGKGMLMNWFSLTLQPGVDGLIEDAWQLAWEVARSSNALDYSNAIFRQGGPGKFDVTLYFSPSARLLAASFGARRCEKPSAPGLSLLAGDERAWDIHFGGRPAGGAMNRRMALPLPVHLDAVDEPMHFEPTYPAGTFEPTHPAPLQ